MATIPVIQILGVLGGASVFSGLLIFVLRRQDSKIEGQNTKIEKLDCIKVDIKMCAKDREATEKELGHGVKKFDEIMKKLEDTTEAIGKLDTTMQVHMGSHEG